MDHSEHDHMNHHHHNHHEMMMKDFKKRFFIILPLTFIVITLSPQIHAWFGYAYNFSFSDIALTILGSFIVLYGGYPFYKEAKNELSSRNWGMMTLVSLAILSGFIFSIASNFINAQPIWWEISTLVLVFLFGHWMEMKAVLKTGNSLEELIKLIPEIAHKMTGKNIEDVKTSFLKKGDVVLIKPGEKIPTDGVVIKGTSSVNESLITGEAKPVVKNNGDTVIGGSLNTDGSLIVKVTTTGKESTLSQIIELIRTAQETKPRIQQQADKAANWLTVIAILVGSSTFIYWMFINPSGIALAATFAISVIVITCPHALGLAIPTVTTITTSLAAKNGILIRDMSSLEVARNLDYVVFDKTGTLTQGNFSVTKIHKLTNLSENEIISSAASLEIHSEHSIAEGIVNYAKSKKINTKEISDFKAIPGKGAKGKIDNSNVYVGNSDMMKDENVPVENPKLDSTGTPIYVAKDDKLIGIIILDDKIRSDSKKTIELLNKNNIKTAMLSGDKKEVAEKIGKELKIDTIYAEVLPKDKVNKVKELQQKGFIVAMVGDGINDAPSLTQANVGIAFGAGTSVAIHSAGIVFVNDNPLDVIKLINLSKKTGTKMKQNIAWATGYNLIAIPIAAGLFASYGLTLQPQWGALIMSASSIIVVFNALTLRKANI